MIRHRHIFLMLIGLSYQLSFAQLGDVQRCHLSAGLTFPVSPDQFYDYWKLGFQVMGGAELPGQSRYIQFITAEVNYFAFDQQRFLKRTGIENSNTPISGAGTYIFGLAYLIRYPFIEYQTYRPTFFAGLGVTDILRSTATIDYLNDPITQGSYNSIVATVPFGISIRVFENGDNAVELNFTYSIAFPKKDDVNSNFTCLKIDYIFSQ